jgi:hypothetical protein
MLRFKEYLELEEGIFGDILTSVKRGISKFVAVMKNALSKLGFGSEKKFSISSLVGTHISEKILDGGNYDLTSRIGYYHEHCVAYDMARILRETGFNVLNQPPSLLNKRQSEKDKISKNRLRFRLAQRKNIDKELKRAEVGAELVAQKIIDDVKKIDDVILMEFEIIHTGTTAANGVAKEDVELVVRKKDTQEVIDDVKASLKAYKKPSINLSNKTFPSYINGILFPKIDLQGKVFLAKFMASNPQYESLVNRMTFYSDGWKKNKKEKGRPYANKVINNQRGFQIIRNGLLLTIFDEAYKKDKKGINERIIQSLGLDGADDVYMAIGTDVNNMKIVSSRSSQAFQKLYQSLKNEFIVRFVIPEDENVVSAKMELIDNDTQEVLLKTTFSFKEGDIFVQFLDMKQILDDDDV